MSTLPTKLAKQIAGKCCYSGCHLDAKDGSDFCDPHDAHERGRDAAKKRRRRQRLAADGRCAAGCGRSVAKRRKRGGGWQARECRVCAKGHRERTAAARAKACVPGEPRAVPGDDEDPRWRVDPGTTWNRYRGKGRRGRLTREEQIDERIRSVDFAFEELRKFRRALVQLKLPEVIELPKIQREAAGREAAFFGSAAVRHVDDALDDLGG